MSKQEGIDEKISEIPIPESPGSVSSDELEEEASIGSLYAPSEGASRLPPGTGGDGDDAIACQLSVFDDPRLRKFIGHARIMKTFIVSFLTSSGQLERRKGNPSPKFTNDRLICKIDWRISSWCCFMFLALQLDRGNILQANSDNFLPDLSLTTNDYNNGQTIFYLSLLLAGVPSQLVSKKLGPNNWYARY